MSPSNAHDHIRPGEVLRISSNGRAISYRADRVDRRAKIVEGAMLDADGSVITGFMMSFEAWQNTAERARA